MGYKLKFSKKFDREFKKLDKPIKEGLWNKIGRLEENPQTGQHLHHMNLWEIRMDKFRMFYMIEPNNNEVWILSVKHKDECDKYLRTQILEDSKNSLNDALP